MAALKRRITIGSKGVAPQRGKGTVATAAAVPKETAGRLDFGRAGLYDDMETPLESQTSEAGILKGLLSSLRDSVASADGSGRKGCVRHELDGIFSKLIEPEQFRKIALSRLSEEERRRAPSSLQELLRTPLYASALEESLPRVLSRAASVLEGVKRRGREQGDVMDAATEQTLKPQVLQESFAREVVGVITAVQATERAQAVSDIGKLASPTREEASWDQLHETTVADLSKHGVGFSVQDSFLGDDWIPTLLEDSLRFAATGKLHHMGLEPEHGEMAWVDAEQLEFGYPALHELIVNLHALSFELNLKDPELRLSRPFQGSTMLLRLTEGCRVPVRLDSVAGGAETGHKISAVYFIGRCRAGVTTTATAADNDNANANDVLSGKVEGDGLAGSGGQLRLRNMEAAAPLAEGVIGSGNSGGDDGSSVAASPQEGETASINGGSEPAAAAADRHRDGPLAPPPPPPRTAAPGMEKKKDSLQRRQEGGVVLLEPAADRLVLFRSGWVSTETLKVLGHGQEQYAVLFWMHGAKEGDGEGAPGAGAGAGVGKRGEAAADPS